MSRNRELAIPGGSQNNMNKIVILAALIICSNIFGATGDLRIQQRSATGAWPDKIFATANSGLIGTDSSGVPTVIRLTLSGTDGATLNIGAGGTLGTAAFTAASAYVASGAITSSGLTMNTARLLGRTTASSGAVEEITAGTSLSYAAGALNTIQGIRVSDSPTFTNLALTGNATIANDKAYKWLGNNNQISVFASATYYDSDAQHIFRPVTSGDVTISTGGNLAATGNLTVSGAGTSSLASALTIAVGKVLNIASGSNQRAGNLTLDTGGTVTVNNTTVTANTHVILTRKTSGGTPGTNHTYTLSAGNSFTVTSDQPLDRSVYTYFLIEVP